MQKIIVLIGPTGIGKTDLALKLAPKINAEIISGDSMQIYQEVSIGTAKPTAEELRQVKHYLVNQRSIFEEYSAKDFVAEGTKAVNQIVAKGSIPLVVGGTGFYINALVNKLQLGEPGDYQTSVDPKWEKYLKENGAEKLWQLLNEKDPDAAKKIAPQNSRRTLRALTVISRTGKLFSQQQAKISPRYDALIIGLNSDREEVYQRINKRVDKMMTAGLLKEAIIGSVLTSRGIETEIPIDSALAKSEFLSSFSFKILSSDNFCVLFANSVNLFICNLRNSFLLIKCIK